MPALTPSVRRAPVARAVDAPLRKISSVFALVQNQDVNSIAGPPVPNHRLRKHADYQRVYREGRKQFSPSMSYFYALRAPDSPLPDGPRVGLTAGKVLGKAVARNRIKRRMRDIVRRRVAAVAANVDIVLHPRRTVLTIEFARLESEVVRIFANIQSAIDKGQANSAKPQAIKQGQ